MRPIKPINDPTKKKRGDPFTDFLTGTKDIIDNCLTCFGDKSMTGFQQLALYRSTLKCISETAKAQLHEFDSVLSDEDRLKFEATEEAMTNSN